MKNTQRFYILSGPSGVGKTSLINAWANINKNIVKVITYTTRKPRKNELDKKHYNFLSVHDFERMLQNGEFSDYRKIFGNYYGISKINIQSIFDQGKSAVADLDVKGALKLSKKFSYSISVYLENNDLEKLRTRIACRSDISLLELDERISQGVEDAKSAHQFDYHFFLSEISEGVEQLEKIFRKQIDDKNT